MKRPAIGHVLGYTALTVILTAGAAESLAGTNTVFSDDIADAQVKVADIGAGAVGSSEVVDNSLRSTDIGPSAVGSSEIADNSVTGADIDESTLTLPAGGGSGNGGTVYRWTGSYVSNGQTGTVTFDSQDDLPDNVIVNIVDYEVVGDFSTCGEPPYVSVNGLDGNGEPIEGVVESYNLDRNNSDPNVPDTFAEARAAAGYPRAGYGQQDGAFIKEGGPLRVEAYCHADIPTPAVVPSFTATLTFRARNAPPLATTPVTTFD